VAAIGQNDIMRIKVIIATIIVLIPGCLDNPGLTTEEDSNFNWAYDGEYSNITMNIFHGENLEDASANYTIKIMLNHAAAPIHTDNMYKHVTAGNYDMTHFHRVIDDFMIQGGDFTNGDGTGGHAADWYGYCNGQSAGNESDCDQTSWTMPDEANNGLGHNPCVISMAKTSAPNTGGSQFFIVPEDSTPEHLDGVHTVFGEITEGCEHITTISEVDTGSNDRPIIPIVIYSATVDN
jgi:peptidyl-prolyl cis-trans isomerase B (cyclophilin B)